MTNCPSNEYPDASTFSCLLCASSCLTCSGTSGNCLTCGLSHAHGVDLFLASAGGQCLMKCPAGEWGNANTHTCDSCQAGCSVCFGGTTNDCTSCTTVNGTVYYLQIGSTICSQTCPDGQFISASIPHFCQPCSISCITCSQDAYNCTSSNCSINYYYLNNSCLTICPTDYYADPVTRHCLSCAVGCLNCFGPGSSQCTSCLTLGNGTTYYLQLFSTNCVVNCGVGEYGLNNRCQNCPPECSVCSSSTSCSTCQSVNGLAYFLSGTSCLSDCGTSNFGDVGTYTCQSCATGCLACYGSLPTECSSCKLDSGSSQHYYLIYGTNECSLTCPDGQYQNTTKHQCLLCSLSCLTCGSMPDLCLSCGLSVGGQTLFLSGTNCLAECPKGFWGNTTDNTC